ncbi:dihydrodipicolinate synthase family protein [Propionibacterium acidifaciens]|uniref:dihydrodipicolinate synthase family protein n=1 Tax=Propionibacterium acidifaciens TaxID=556499 RepID=UPI0009DBE841
MHGLSPSDSTGEVTHLTPAQREPVVRITVDEAAGRVPVVAGVAAFAIADAATQAQAMASWGRRPRLHPAGPRPAVPRRDRRPRPRARHGHGPAGRPLHESASRTCPCRRWSGSSPTRRCSTSRTRPG